LINTPVAYLFIFGRMPMLLVLWVMWRSSFMRVFGRLRLLKHVIALSLYSWGCLMKGMY